MAKDEKSKKSSRQPKNASGKKTEKTAEKKTPAASADECAACGGRLVELEDYVFSQRLRRAAACVPVAVALCVAWAVVFALVRVGVGGKLAGAGGGAIAALIAQKVLVGAILGAVIGVLAGVWRSDVGLFLGVVAGSLGGFFVAAAPMMPLLSDAAHRTDIIIAAIGGGVLSGATVLIAHAWACRRFESFIGPEPQSENQTPS